MLLARPLAFQPKWAAVPFFPSQCRMYVLHSNIRPLPSQKSSQTYPGDPSGGAGQPIQNKDPAILEPDCLESFFPSMVNK